MTIQGAELREQVRARYAAAAVAVTTGHDAGCGSNSDCCSSSSSSSSSCCSPSSCAPGSIEVDETFGAGLYTADERGELPAEAIAASLGCGNPIAVADLHPGERVLDLGSGGVSTSCFLLAGLVKPASPTAST